MQYLFASLPMWIGKHQWRIVVTLEGHTRYEFRRPPIKAEGFMVTDDTWRNYREWPTYNFDDGMYAGLPKSIQKLWEANRVEIERILHGKEPAQMGLL